MAPQVGICLDRSKAFIVSIIHGKTRTATIISDIDETRHPRCGTEGRCTIIPERRLRQRRQELVRKFYRSIIQSVRDAGMIVVFGPGAAKSELVREMERCKPLRAHVIGLATTDKLALRQAELRVLEFYAMHPVAS